MSPIAAELLHTAARLAVEQGLDFRTAKQSALKQLKLPARTPLPDNDALEAAVREHLAVFHADTQPIELAALRQLALDWMQRLADFEPLVGGAVWHGTATRLSDVYLQLFCDDPKMVEIALIDQQLRYEVTPVSGLGGRETDALSLHVWCEALTEHVGLHLLVNDALARRGALRADARGRQPRGTRAQLLQRMHSADAATQ